jgi:hypothetical protein
LFANFFARIEKLVVDCFLTLSFNLVALDFANDEKLLKTTTTIFLKSFFVLASLPIATTTRGVRGAIDDDAKVEGNANYIDILKASRLHAN